MKNSIYLVLVLLATITVFSCKNNSKNAEVSEPDTKVKVYYFHGEQRCPTCIAVGEVSLDVVKTNFADNKDVSFTEVDFSTKDGEAIADKYEIANSSLLIVSGDKVIDLTDDAFAFAKNDPEKLKKIIIDQINKML
jgi:hypothetical protein